LRVARLRRYRETAGQGLHGMLGPQDRIGWRPHVTIQNKVAPKVGRALLVALERDFAPRPLAIRGLGLHRYVDGPWETLGTYPFRG
jgi:hypothetical protein